MPHAGGGVEQQYHNLGLRHFGAGRLCELIGNFRAPKSNQMFSGKSVADIDAFVRPLEFEAQSARDFDRTSSRGRECLEAFRELLPSMFRLEEEPGI